MAIRPSIGGLVDVIGYGSKVHLVEFWICVGLSYLRWSMMVAPSTYFLNF